MYIAGPVLPWGKLNAEYQWHVMIAQHFSVSCKLLLPLGTYKTTFNVSLRSFVVFIEYKIVLTFGWTSQHTQVIK